VTDVANAIFDGADAVMLSGETAAGKYPVQVIETMARIVVEAEAQQLVQPRPWHHTTDISTGVAAAAVEAADRLGAAALIAYTESGRTARIISELRPKTPIFAFTPRHDIVRRLSLYWGVRGLVAPPLANSDQLIAWTRKVCVEKKLAPKGAVIVIVAGQPSGEGRTNLLTVREL
jgi:pyruvate kinase